MRMRLVGPAMALVSAMAMSACGGSDESGIKPLDSASTSPETTATAPPSAPSRPDDVKSSKGALAFAEFATQTILYVSQSKEADELFALTRGTSCVGCTKIVKAIGKPGEGTRQVFDGTPTVTGASVEDDKGPGYLVVQSVTIPKGRRIDEESGAVSDRFDATRYKFDVAIRWSGKRWILTDYYSEKK